jgi:hypothetical protein
MTRFLKLSRQVNNTAHITSITHTCRNETVKDAYVIYTNELDISGLFIFGFGWVDNTLTKIEISLDENKSDYLKIKRWLDSEYETHFIQVKDHNKDCL